MGNLHHGDPYISVNSRRMIFGRLTGPRFAVSFSPGTSPGRASTAGPARSGSRGAEVLSVWTMAGLGLALIGIHLSLLLRIESSAQLGLSLLVWPAIIHMVYNRWSSFTAGRSIIELLMGTVVLAVVLVNSLWMSRSNHVYPYLYPLIAGLGLGLLVVGWRGLSVYWRELTLLALLGIPRLLLTAWDHLPLMTAKVATFLVWYLGYEVQLRGVEIIMPGGAVIVDQGCAGPGVISYLLCLAAVFGFLFPVNAFRCVLALVIAPLIAVCTNLGRVVVLALMENAGRHDLFTFWHNGSGSVIWTMLPVMLFFMLAMGLIERRRAPVNRSRRKTEPRADHADDERPVTIEPDSASCQEVPISTGERR